MDTLGLRRYCCRRMIISHTDVIEKLLNGEPFANSAEPDQSLTVSLPASQSLVSVLAAAARLIHPDNPLK